MSDYLGAPPPSTPAGWYDNPSGDGRLRYWDGTAWTQHYMQRPAPTIATTSPHLHQEPVQRDPAQGPDRRGWRWRHSAWLLAPILGLGLLSWVGFIYCAIRIRTRPWITLAVISLVLTVVGYIWLATTNDVDGNSDANASLYLVQLWIASIVFGCLINRDYLKWRAHRNV